MADTIDGYKSYKAYLPSRQESNLQLRIRSPPVYSVSLREEVFIKVSLQGVEPQSAESKSAVLPLYEREVSREIFM